METQTVDLVVVMETEAEMVDSAMEMEMLIVNLLDKMVLVDQRMVLVKDSIHTINSGHSIEQAKVSK